MSCTVDKVRKVISPFNAFAVLLLHIHQHYQCAALKQTHAAGGLGVVGDQLPIRTAMQAILLCA